MAVNALWLHFGNSTAMHNEAMATKIREINPFGLRLPPEVKRSLEREAKSNHRSLNAEIVSRLQANLNGTAPPANTAAHNVAGYGANLTELDRAMLGVFKQLSPERQLALLSLFK